MHSLDIVSLNVDVGKYSLFFKVSFSVVKKFVCLFYLFLQRLIILYVVWRFLEDFASRVRT